MTTTTSAAFCRDCVPTAELRCHLRLTDILEIARRSEGEVNRDRFANGAGDLEAS